MAAATITLRRYRFAKDCCRLALGVAVCLLVPGCQSLRQRGPVPRSVANCRQMTQQGQAAIERGDWGKAEQLLGRATESCPVDSDARRYYAEALWRRGAREDALRQMREAVECSPEDAQLVLDYGQMQLEVGSTDDAWRAANRALQIDAQLADAWGLRGRALRATGQLPVALTNYQRGLAIAPSDRQLLGELAELYQQLNQPERALMTVQTLLDLHSPGDEPARALELQGRCLASLGRPNDATESLTLACQRSAPTADLLLELGKCQLNSNQFEAAEATIQQAQSLHPDAPATVALQNEMQVALDQRSPPVRR
jgi:tetratricopeptide (TPR) repeat protein